MDHNMVLSYDYSSRNKRWWWTNVPPSRAILMSALPDAAWPRLHRKSLDTAIWWLLAPYRPGGRQGDNQHNDKATCTPFAGRFDGHRDAAVLYRAHRSIEEVRGFHKSHWRPPLGEHSLRYCPIGNTNAGCFGHYMLAPNNNRGMTYQTDEKNLNNMVEYYVGVVKIAHCCYITRFLWHVINQDIEKLLKCHLTA
jgi:hypothetical protein